MEIYNRININEICKKVCSGGTPKSTHTEYYGGNIPWLNTKEVNFNRIYKTEKNITESGLENSSAKWIEPNAVIVAMYGATAGKTAIAKIPLTTNQACCNLMIDEEKADYRFVYYALCNDYIRLASLANGGAQQNLNAQQIKDFDIPYPEVETQQKIANILSSLDDKIEVNRRINEQLEELAQALFKSWFVDFEPFKDGEFVECELGMIPVGWKVGKFTDIVDIKGGGTPKTDIAEYWNGDIPFFTPKDINDVFCIGTEKNITDLGLSKCSSKLYSKNTVFITARGTVGKVCMAGRDMAMNQTCYALIGKKKYGQHFIYMQTISIVERMKKKANGAVFSAITTRDFDSEKIIIPSLDIVSNYLMKIEPLYESILHNQQEITHLTNLRDTLLPKLMSGEIDVNEVEI